MERFENKWKIYNWLKKTVFLILFTIDLIDNLISPIKTYQPETNENHVLSSIKKYPQSIKTV